MKKILLILAAVLLVSGAVWGQAAVPAPGLDTGFTSVRETLDFSAVKTVSTETRYGNGGFSSDIDDFIHPAYFNPQIGTFFFLGGFPSNGTNVQTSDFLTNNWAVSFGFAKSFNEGASYLGIYYGGSLVEGTAEGHTVTGSSDYTYSNLTWQNSLALLFGTSSFGIRLDLIFNNVNDEIHMVNGNVYEQEITSGASLALTFGTTILETTPLWITAGFVFPQTSITTDGDQDNNPTNTATGTIGAALGLIIGAEFSLSETSTLTCEVYAGGSLADTYVPLTGDTVTEGGSFGVAFDAIFTKTLTFGNATVKIMPGAYLEFDQNTNSDSSASETPKPTSKFNLAPRLDIGFRYTHEILSIYTGFGLELFNWNVYFQDKDSQWTFSGISWDGSKLSAGQNLYFGVTFEPIENLVFGMGLQTGLVINPRTMNMSGASTASLNIPTGSLTISYKF